VVVLKLGQLFTDGILLDRHLRQTVYTARERRLL
jgi:hypothetical protein